MTSDGGPYLGAFVRKREAQKKGFIWGEVRYRGPKHLITVGPPGACKSAGLVVPNVANLARSMLIIDPKGELAAITARKRAEFGRVVVLNPFGLFADELPHLKSDGFNPLRQLDPLSESFPDEAAAIASALIPIKSEHNKFFPLSARNIITAFVMWERMQRGEAAHLLDVRQSIMAPTAYGPDKKTPVSGFMKSIFDMAMSDYYPVADLGGRLFERLTDKGSHNTSVQDVLETLVAETGFLSSPPIAADLKGEGFDFRDMRREIVTVYLILPTAQIQTHAIWLRLIITSALRSLYQPVSLSDKATLPPVLFVLDEFAQLGRLDAIEAALGIARGSGVQLWPFLQD
ncbi:MAG: type IV secretory system conjugative DNA transfer family protein, partial [Methylobacteriaceae bacterium]|nr:type IV secretory system conjugative DNA transfer family protein [Methylobacteriaceae bacterium]